MPHTPEPWEVFQSIGPIHEMDAEATFWEVTAPAAGGKWIAHVQEIGDEQANARLVAAAPSLLAACQMFVEYADETYEVTRGPMEIAHRSWIDAAIRAAVAKAVQS